MLMGILFLAKKKPAFDFKKMTVLYAVLLTISAVGLFQKWTSAFIVISAKEWEYNRPFADRSAAIHLPTSYYNPENYTTYGLFEKIEKENVKIPIKKVDFIPQNKSHFGQILPMNATFEEPVFVQTNVAPFPWNKFTLDGKNVDLVLMENFLGFYAPAGTHEISILQEPDVLWNILDWISSLVFFIWLIQSLRIYFRTLNISSSP